LLVSWGNQAAFIKVQPTIWAQDLMGRQQLASSMSLTFFQELLLGNPKDFGPWDFFIEPGISLTSCKITISHLVLSDTCPNERDDVHFGSMSETEIDKFYNNAV
jgi:hypothetical protein